MGYTFLISKIFKDLTNEDLEQLSYSNFLTLSNYQFTMIYFNLQQLIYLDLFKKDAMDNRNPLTPKSKPNFANI